MFFNLIPQKICRVFSSKNTVTNTNVASVAILLNKNADNLPKNFTLKQEAFPHTRISKNKGLNDFKIYFGTFLHPIYEGTFRNIQALLEKELDSKNDPYVSIGVSIMLNTNT